MNALLQNLVDLAQMLVWGGLWTLGGWWLARGAFRLEEEEEGLIGFGLGLVSQVLLTNFLARVLSVSAASWVASGLVFLCGLGLAARLGWRNLLRLKIVPWHWASMALIVAVFFPLSRGLAIFDEFIQLPTLSTMAAGEIPPRFSLDPAIPYGYHYFLHILAAQVMNVGRWYLWNAWDLARVISLALAVALAAQWTRRVTRSATAGLLAGLTILFATGTRWLLLLLPNSLLLQIGENMELLGSGAHSGSGLADALVNAWAIEGGGPLPFPFAFSNGLIHPGVLNVYVGTGMMAAAVLLLALSTFHRTRGIAGLVVLAWVLSANGLLGETSLLLNLAGWGFVTAAWVIRSRSFRLPAALWQWWGVLAAVWILVAIQGGAWTDVIVGLFQRLATGTASASYQSIGFKLVWPPTVISSHLGVLPIGNPLTLLVALLEAGPLLLVLPLVAVWGCKAFKLERWFEAALAAEAFISLLTVFVQFTGSTGIRNTPRLYTFLPITLLLAVPLVWWWSRRRGRFARTTAVVLAGLALSGGVVMFFAQLPAAQRPVYSFYLTKLDAMMAKDYWNRLEPDALVFDSLLWRGVAVFGRHTDAGVTWFQIKPEFSTLAATPDPVELNASGFSYAYIDQAYWYSLSEADQALLESPCVKILKEVREDGIWRRLLDLRGCR